MQKRGQSQIIVTILLILLVLASVIIVWNVINSFLESGSSEIGIEGLVTKVEITSAKYYLAGGVEVVVRNLGGNIDSINFIFYDSDGLTKVIEKTDNIPGELETSTYSFTLEETGSFEKISIIPKIGNKNGLEIFNKNEIGIKEPFNDESLLYWWDFEGNYIDKISNHVSIHSYDTIIIIDPERGSVVNFDGDDDGINIADRPNLHFGTNDFSVSAWVYANNLDDDFTIIDFQPAGNGHSMFNYYNGTGRDSGTGWGFRVRRKALEGEAIVHSIHVLSEGSEGTSINEWHNIVLSRIGNDWKIYRDSVEIAAGTNSVSILNGNSIRVGRCNDCDSGIHTLDGKLDDLMIFDKGLSNDEVSILYNSLR